MSEFKQASNGRGLLVAVAVGAAVGAGVALLCAPRSGKETRRWLANSTQEVKDRTASAFEHGKDAVRGVVKAIGKDTEEAVNARERPAYAEAGATAKRS